MGTNYYAITDSCDCCGRYETLHICKNFTMFRGWPNHDPALMSWSDWKEFLSRDRVDRVEDEYGRHLTVIDFVASVEATDELSRRRQVDWMHKNASWVGPFDDYLDADGFSFTLREFF